MGDSTLPDIDELPVLPELKNGDKFVLAINSVGSVFIFHGIALPENPDYIEFDMAGKAMTLAYDTGRIQPLGIEIPQKLHPYLNQTDHIFVVHTVDKKEQQVFKVPFLING